ncbi:Oleandomycin glycosyltransferase [Mycolicibacterium chlorophenolicum]|uniref:Oleandomycin glycosyltransferase n=2 Tax=Mycolicibacterium chlorophenolicum TaxID=37916 RepID=A0A0J6WM16_9MYCO|nr:Oleandomycin glycosyltransferase [Mycolicibacterium chlorophenolicum]
MSALRTAAPPIAVMSVGSVGHLNPMLPVIAELSRRGRRVVVYGRSPQRALVERAGASLRPYPDVPAREGRPLKTPIAFLDLVATMTRRLMPWLVDDIGDLAPSMMVHDAAALWGKLAARVTSTPAASAISTFAFNNRFRAPDDPVLSIGTLVRMATSCSYSAGTHYAWERLLLAMRRQVPLAPLRRAMENLEDLNIVFTSREIQPAAETFDDRFLFVGASIGNREPDDSFAWDRLEDPVTFVSLGTTFSDRAGVISRIVRALDGLPGSLVVASGHVSPAEIGRVGARTIVTNHVPQPELLGRATVFVTHAGMNSAMESLAAGTPMVALPQGADQPLVAARIAELGTGIDAGSDPTAQEIRSAVMRVISDPSYAAAARTMGRTLIEAGGPRRAADALLEYEESSRSAAVST